MTELANEPLATALTILPSMGQWRAYPAYKNSGVEWVGEIPEHWEVRRLKFIASFFGGGTPSKENIEYWSGNIPWVSPKDMKAATVCDAEDHITEEAVYNSATRIVPPGSVLIVVRSGILRHSIPVAINTEPVAINQDMKAIIPKTYVSSGFLAYIITGHQRALLVEWRKSGTTVESIEFELLVNTSFPVPPLPEQHIIAAFLDRETAHIDGLIARKERLIELLQERRGALISQAVTKGLHADAPMKDSGVEWIGEIPAHWDVVMLKRVVRIRYGLGQPPAQRPDGAPLLRATNVKSGKIVKEGMMHVDPTDIPSGRSAVLSTGEIIVVRSGAYTGDSAIVPPEYDGSIIGYDLVLTAVNAHSSFIAWQLLTKAVRYLQFDFYRLRAAQPHLNAEEVAGTLITLPPLSEQQAIAAYLDEETAKLDGLISRIRESIKKLQEYRTALISAAVTGKIDVRQGQRRPDAGDASEQHGA